MKKLSLRILSRIHHLPPMPLTVDPQPTMSPSQSIIRTTGGSSLASGMHAGDSLSDATLSPACIPEAKELPPAADTQWLREQRVKQQEHRRHDVGGDHYSKTTLCSCGRDNRMPVQYSEILSSSATIAPQANNEIELLERVQIVTEAADRSKGFVPT